MRCRTPNGEVRWQGVTHNLITNAGLETLVSGLFGGQPARTWHLTLKTPGPVTPTDTLTSASWSEFTSYSGERVAWAPMTPAPGARRSTAIQSFTITGAPGERLPVGGVILVSGPTKGVTTDTLFSAVNWGRAKVAFPGDIIDVTYEVQLRAGTSTGAYLPMPGAP